MHSIAERGEASRHRQASPGIRVESRRGRRKKCGNMGKRSVGPERRWKSERMKVKWVVVDGNLKKGKKEESGKGIR